MKKCQREELSNFDINYYIYKRLTSFPPFPRFAEASAEAKGGTEGGKKKGHP